MKAKFYLSIFVLMSTFASAQIVSKTLQVATPGTLSSLLNADEKNTITNLILSGNIDARDFTCMRDEIIMLNEVDISGVTIASYSGSGGTNTSKTNYLANQIPEYAFSNNTTSKGKVSLAHILLPGNITFIDNYSFFACTGLLDITIPNSVITMGEGTFKGCRNMLNVSIGNSVSKIGNTAFYNCYGLTSVVIPNSVTEIGSSAFYQCANLASINIPNSVKSIGDHAFEACGWATSITLGNGIENIGTEAFKDCLSITYVSINRPVGPIINTSTFSGMQEWSVLFEVPIGRAQNYSSAAGWVEFFNIKEKDFSTKLKAFENDLTNIYASPSGIIVDGTKKGEVITVYTISGTQKHLIKSEGGQVTIPVFKSAIYLVKTAYKTVKVVL
jgi:hypothetical protein